MYVQLLCTCALVKKEILADKGPADQKGFCCEADMFAAGMLKCVWLQVIDLYVFFLWHFSIVIIGEILMFKH